MPEPFQIVAELLPGAFLVQPRVVRDARGAFVKTFHEDAFRALGLPVWAAREEYWSVSAAGVVRGMHFQLPPHDHEKAVACVAGRVLDVVLDLRRGPGYGRHASAELSAENGRFLLLPRGVAHGFASLEDGTVLLYKVATVYAPEHDAGVRWDSFGFAWPVTAPVLSPRDERHPALVSFDSPFPYPRGGLRP